METTRRNFLQTTAAAVTFVLASGGLRAFGQQPPDDLFAVPGEAYSDPLFSLTMRQAEALLGTPFTTTVVDERTLAGARTVRLILTEVNPLERKGNSARGYYGESFSLIFVTQQRVLLGQGAYRLSGGGLTLDDVLLVPTGIAHDKYEVIVNHVTR